MKKLLAILASISMVASTGVTVVACGTTSHKSENNSSTTDQQELMEQVIARVKAMTINDQLGIDQSLTKDGFVGSTTQTMINENSTSSIKTNNVNLTGNIGTVNQLFDSILKAVGSGVNIDATTMQTIESTITGALDQAGGIIDIVVQLLNTSTISSLIPTLFNISGASSTIENVSKLLDAALKKVDISDISKNIDPILGDLASMQDVNAVDENNNALKDYSLNDMQDLMIVDIANIASFATGSGSYINSSKDNKDKAITYFTSLLDNINFGNDSLTLKNEILTDGESNPVTTSQLVHSIIQIVQILQDWVAMFDTSESRAVEITDSTKLFSSTQTDFEYFTSVYSSKHWGDSDFFGTINFGSLINNIKYHVADNENDSTDVKEYKLRKFIEILTLSGDQNDKKCVLQLDKLDTKDWYYTGSDDKTGLNELMNSTIDMVADWGNAKIQKAIDDMGDSGSQLGMIWKLINDQYDVVVIQIGLKLNLIKSLLSYGIYSMATGHELEYGVKIDESSSTIAQAIKDKIGFLYDLIAPQQIKDIVDNISGDLKINIDLKLPSFHDIYTGVSIDNVIDNLLNGISITLPGGLGLDKIDVHTIVNEIPEGIAFIDLQGDITEKLQTILKMDQIQDVIKNKIEKPINDIFGTDGQKINLNNLINLPITDVAGNIYNSAAQMISPHADALMPQEIGKYSLANIINVIADGFGTNESNGKCKKNEDLKDYYLNFAALKNAIDILVTSNTHSSNTDSPTSLLQDIGRDGSTGDMNKLLDDLGYTAKNKKVYTNSFIGQLVEAFIPSLSTTNDTIALKDISKGHDNLSTFIKGIYGLTDTLFEQVDYTDYVNALISQQDNLFKDQEVVETTYFGNSKDIKSMKINFTFDLSGFQYNNQTYNGAKYQGFYQVEISKNSANDTQYNINSISRS